jgi:hypothetical protein
MVEPSAGSGRCPEPSAGLGVAILSGHFRGWPEADGQQHKISGRCFF